MLAHSKCAITNLLKKPVLATGEYDIADEIDGGDEVYRCSNDGKGWGHVMRGNDADIVNFSVIPV